MTPAQFIERLGEGHIAPGEIAGQALQFFEQYPRGGYPPETEDILSAMLMAGDRDDKDLTVIMQGIRNNGPAVGKADDIKNESKATTLRELYNSGVTGQLANKIADTPVNKTEVSSTGGDIWRFPPERGVLKVIPMNAEGVAGAGLAKQMKQKFPNTARAYTKHAMNGYFYTNGKFDPTRAIVDSQNNLMLVATKDKWKNPSKMEYIDGVIEAIKSNIEKRKAKKIIIPKIGAGLGGLKWPEVRQRILDGMQGTEVEILFVE